jgi:selenocysteine-specific elongation factor
MKVNSANTEIIPVMIGTAGHVDHGKTALVKHLTGRDTDTLPEEKQRGLSIDLGFAPYVFSGGQGMAGIIDVPGHEDFIRNMVAGASSVDVLILVVAADDGIMPQTVEHLRIASLLCSSEVMAVITKTDLVSPARVIEVSEKVSIFLSGSGFPGAPVVTVSNRTGEGMADVKKALESLALRVKRPKEERAFRMNIERVFSIEGHGAVVTGIPSSGKCTAGDELELFPGSYGTAARSIQKYSHEAGYTEAHVCSAINIKKVKIPDIARGMTLTAPGSYRETYGAVLSIRNMHGSFTIKHRQEFRFLAGTSAKVVSGLLLTPGDLAPGKRGYMRIRCAEPMLLAAGDRYIMRSLSPSDTIGGGRVLAANAGEGGKGPKIGEARLSGAEKAVENNEFFVSELLAGASLFMSRGEMPFLAHAGAAQTDKAVSDLVSRGILEQVGPSYWVVKGRMDDIERTVKAVISRYHANNKYSRGISGLALCAELGLDKNAAPGLKKILAASSEIMESDGHFSIKGFKPGLSSKQAALKDKILENVVSAGRNALTASAVQLKLGIQPAEMELLTRVLAGEGAIIVIEGYLVPAAFLGECAERIKTLFAKEKTVALGAFRAEAGISRNLAVPILEYFDAKGVTRREGNGRVLLGG